MIGEDLAHVDIDQIKNVVLAAGYDSGKIWFEASNDNGRTHTAAVEVASGDDEQPAIRILTTGEIMVALTAGEATKLYMSWDSGLTWEFVDAV